MSRPRSGVLAVALVAVGCSGIAPRPPALAQNRELEAFAAAAAYPNAEPAVALLAAQQYMAAHREQEGYEVFRRLARGILRAMVAAHRTLGDEARSRELLRQSGDQSLEAPAVLTDVSVGPEEGFRFTRPALVREAEGIYVAGLAAVREPGTVVIARANSAQELARMRSSQQSFSWFFGTRPVDLHISGARLVSGEEVLRHGKLEIRLLPVSGGETDDALFVHLPQHGLLFVGDAFMPYVGPPLLSEGSPEGYLEALALVRTLAPRRLIHGHPVLTRFFNMDALPGLEASLRSLYERYRLDALHS